jgi:hypothetical protein
MGASSWSNDSYSNLKRDYSTKSTTQIFSSQTLDNDMSPKDVKFRESRDSDVHPNSVAIAVFLDETGSMGKIPEILVREKLGTLMTTLIAHGVPDAHVMFGGIGDHYADSSPLQVGQYEAGTDELNKWLTKIYLEGNGGGQNKESYPLAWLFAGRHTSIDCFEKRDEKGFLFTIGDESYHPTLEAAKLKELLGYDFSEDISAETLLSEAQRMYNVFHLHIRETSTGSKQSIIDSWKKLLGERVIVVEDFNSVAEIIASTVAVVLGADLKNVVSGFDDNTAKQVTNALVLVGSNIVSNKQKEGIRTL